MNPLEFFERSVEALSKSGDEKSFHKFHIIGHSFNALLVYLKIRPVL